MIHDIILLILAILLIYIFAIPFVIVFQYACYKLGWPLESPVERVVFGPGEIIAHAVAKYRFYLEQENRKAQEAARRMQHANELTACLGEYRNVAGIIVKAINNTVGYTGINKVNDIGDITIADFIEYHENGCMMYLYHFSSPLGSDISANIVERYIQGEANRIYGNIGWCRSDDYDKVKGYKIFARVNPDGNGIISVVDLERYTDAEQKRVNK
jgi:hypothetical protein